MEGPAAARTDLQKRGVDGRWEKIQERDGQGSIEGCRLVSRLTL